MYWIDTRNGTLHCRIGDTVVNTLPDTQNATRLALNGFDYYWTEKTDDNTWGVRYSHGRVGHYWGVREVVLTGTPMGMAIADRKVYVSVVSGKIQRLRVDGSDFQPDFITGLAAPGSIDVDVGDGKLYWTDGDSIWRASLTGENIERVLTDLGAPAHLILDE